MVTPTECFVGQAAEPIVRIEATTAATHIAEPSLSDPFRVGELVSGTYRVTGVLGSGGMGVVYDATDEVLDRRVALKVSTLAVPDLLRDEGRALAALNSPFFVGVHAFGEHAGTGYIVLERLSGETLDVRIADAVTQGRLLTVADALEILSGLAEALATAHAAGITQRDLKPSNVILTGTRLVLFDMGIAVPEALVHPGAVVAGSIPYMAPEVLLGRVQRGSGPMVDLYALGIIGYELLTGTTPFGTTSARETLGNHVLAPVPDVRNLRPDVPSELAQLVAELMAKEPSDRPPSAEAVLWQLEALKTRSSRTLARGIHVLAVDDDPSIGDALKRTLESHFPRLQVETTTEPLVAMDEHGPPRDVVLVDLNMPEHNGIEVCMHLASLPQSRRPLVVAMSAEATERDVEVLRALGVRDFVAKDASFITAMSAIIGRVRASCMPSSRPTPTLSPLSR